MRSFRVTSQLALSLAALSLTAQTPSAPVARRPFQPNDYYRMHAVRDPQQSPDGAWVAYTVSTPDSATDKNVAHIWMTSWDGTQTVQLTAGKESESSPRFSPLLGAVDEAVRSGVADPDRLGLRAPWTSQKKWIDLSYPMFHADRIKTPTLFMGGASDFNVPLVGGEQMYQALRALGVPTELVIYPGQFHGITRPSFVVDRMKRWVAWYDKYVKGEGTPK